MAAPLQQLRMIVVEGDAIDRTLLAVAFAALYGFSAAPHPLGGDAALFATIFADGGYAHPPGYPLYSLYLMATSWLPAASPAHGASIATSFLGVGAVVLLHDAARRWGLSRFAAAVAAVSFGIASGVWRYQTQPEVFALNHLIAASILVFAAPDAPAGGVRRAGALGLLAGLGLANHHTIVLVAPVGIYGLSVAVRESDALPSCLAAASGAGLLGLLPYLHLVAVSHGGDGWHWGEATDLSSLVHHFLRSDYGTFQLTTGDAAYRPVEQIRFFAVQAAGDLLYIGAALALLGGGVALARLWDQTESHRAGPATIVAAAVLAGPGFVSLLTFEPEGVHRALLRRFHLLPVLFLALLAGVGAESLERQIDRPLIEMALPISLFVFGGLAGWPTVARHHDAAVLHYLQDTIEPLPDDAVLIGTGDHNFFGTLYYRRAIDRRRDIDYVDATMLAHRWYNRRVNRRLGIEFPYRGEDVDLDELFRAVQRTGRPLFLANAFHPEVLKSWPTAPFGTTIRVYPERTIPPPPREVFRTNIALLDHFSLVPDPRPLPGSWRQFVQRDYAASFRTVARALETAGAPAKARRARRAAALFEPDASAPSR